MSQPLKTKAVKPRCGLCGKTKNLTKTECCGQWICDDEHKYVLFSYARSSCSRNHRRFTLCGFHSGEGHKGHWKDCKKCRASFQTEIYVWYGTNEYNFEKLENPPHYEPTLCDRCGVVIKLGTDGYSVGPKGTICERCNYEEHYQPTAKAGRRVVPRKLKPQLPVNSNPDAIEIILSAQVRKNWRVEPTVRATEPPAHWLGQWRLDFGRKPDRTRWALVTNVATLYTFVFPVKELGRRENFEKLFRLRLGFAIVDAPKLALWKDATIVYAAGNPRMAVGSMNNMRQHLAWRTETSVGPMKDDEDWINQTPFLSLPEAFPDKAFAERLTEANQLNVKSR
jgi:predicted nucleic-acid-binding Zn-ribbon protein